MSETKNNDSNGNLPTLITGIAIGAAITYMFTTETGKKIRDELIKEGSKILENIGDEVEKAKDKVQDEGEQLLEGVKEKKAEIEAEIHSSAKQAKKEINQIASNITEVVDESVPDQIHEIQKKGRHFFFSKKSHPKSES